MAGQGEDQAELMDEREWRRRTGIPSSDAATVAFYIISHSGVFPESRMAKSPLPDNFLYNMRQGRFRELRSWRFPGTDIDLFQLAVLYNNHRIVSTLIAKGFFRENKYQDGSGTYRNHPLHLASHCAGPGVLEWLLHCSLLPSGQVGEVSVTADPGQCTPEAPVLQLPTPVQGSSVRFAALNQKPVAHVLLSEFLFYHRLNRHLTERKVESLWRLLDLVYEKGVAPRAAYRAAYPGRFERDQPDDYFLMVCQLFHQDKRPIGKECVALCALVSYAVQKKRPDLVQVAASYCRQEQLHGFVQHVENRRAKPAFPSDRPWTLNVVESEDGPVDCCTYNHLPASKWKQATDIFEEERANRTLEHETMLTILESVGGNPRKAQLLDQLPKLILEKFKVPFQSLYDDLTASSQKAQEATPQ